MNKQDWNTAPKDAQFYSCGHFGKHEDDKEFCLVSSIWCECAFGSLDWHKRRNDFEMRPEVPVWDGKSALKAGSKAMTSGGECIVLGIDLSMGEAAVQWLNNGELGVILISCIKPALTDRDKWIEAALKEYGGPVFSTVGNCLKPVLGRIYDAGLGKLPDGI